MAFRAVFLGVFGLADGVSGVVERFFDGIYEWQNEKQKYEMAKPAVYHARSPAQVEFDSV